MIIQNLETHPFELGKITIIYDGECPVCSAYIKISIIKKTYGEVRLINARNESEIIFFLKNLKLDINEGIVVFFNDKLYYASDAMNILAILGSNVKYLSKFINFFFKNKIFCNFIYPLLKFGRRCLLFILRRKLI